MLTSRKSRVGGTSEGMLSNRFTSLAPVKLTEQFLVPAFPVSASLVHLLFVNESLPLLKSQRHRSSMVGSSGLVDYDMRIKHWPRALNPSDHGGRSMKQHSLMAG